VLEDWGECRRTVLADVQESGWLGAGDEGFDPDLCPLQEATWALRRPGRPPFLLFSRLVDDEEESPSGYAFVVDAFEVEPTGEISESIDFPETFWDCARADEILGDSCLVARYEDPSLPALPVPEEIAHELWYGDEALSVLRLVDALGLDPETECPEALRGVYAALKSTEYLVSSYAPPEPISSPMATFMARRVLTDADPDRMAAPYEDGSFEPEPDGEVYSGSHLDGAAELSV
jgi:hypothetical protein